MFVYWGTRRVRRRAGRVADCCPICRDLTAWRATRIGVAGHLYGVSITKGALVGYELQCESCGLSRDAEPDAFSGFVRDRDADVASLVAATHPGVERANAALLAEGRRIREGRITRQERAALVLRSIRHLDNLLPAEVSRPAGRRRFRILFGIGLAVAVVSSLGLLNPSPEAGGSRSAFLVAWFVGLCLMAWAVFLWITRTRHCVRRRLQPLAVHSLKPLGPDRMELASALAQLAAEGSIVARHLDPAEMSDRIQEGVGK